MVNILNLNRVAPPHGSALEINQRVRRIEEESRGMHSYAPGQAQMYRPLHSYEPGEATAGGDNSAFDLFLVLLSFLGDED